MTRARHSHRRGLGNQPYRKLFLIAVEGNRTEVDYFNQFKSLPLALRVECLKSGNKSAPPHVLAKLKKKINDCDFRPTDEAWLVIDKDSWPDAQLEALVSWATTDTRFGLAVSNPCFEYWLVLHFEDGADIATKTDCRSRLHRYLSGYQKSLDREFRRDDLENAVRRGKARDNPPCDGWPRRGGVTTAYKLVENMLNCPPTS